MGRPSKPAPMDTVLVIDDEPALRDVYRIALESAHYRVIEAADGDTGIRLYREERPRLAIVDLHMPKRSGKEVIQEILTIDPRACIIVASGDLPVQEAEIADFARGLGAQDAIEKPFRRQQLLATVDRILKASQGPSEPCT